MVPALPQTPRRASPIGGEGRGVGVAVEDVDMVGTNSGGVVHACEEEGIGCGCNCRTLLAGVQREMASQVRKMREEVMGAFGLLLAERGLETWAEGRRLERARVAAKREHEV